MANLAKLGDLNGANMAKMLNPKIDNFFDASFNQLFLEFG